MSHILIKPGETKDTVYMKGRDVEFELKDVEMDPRVRSVLYRLAEGLHLANKKLVEMAQIIDMQTDTIANVASAIEGAHVQLKRLTKQEPDIDDNITTETF